MNAYSKKIIASSLLVLLLPISTLSADSLTLEAKLKELSLQSAATNKSLYQFPRVLGHNTDTTTLKVTKTLADETESEYEDITFQPPTDWSISEEIDSDGIFSTYLLSGDYTAQIAIHRVYDPEVTLDSLIDEIEAVCEVCGYTIKDKEEREFLGEDGIFFAIQAEGERFDQYATVIDDVAYIATISTASELWRSYYPIMEQSLETVVVNDMEQIKNPPAPTEPQAIDTADLESIITLIGAGETAAAEAAITEAVANPDTDPFVLYGYSVILFHFLENREQAAFVFHIAQLRSGAYANIPLDYDAYDYLALRSSLDDMIGEIIFPWVGSDIEAWKKLAQGAIDFEQTLGYPKNLLMIEGTVWETLVDEARTEYQAGMEEYLLPVTPEEMRTLRSENGLYIGPWQNPGDPLPAAWKK